MGPRPRPQLDKLANGKQKPMSRTSGVAGRLTKRDEGIATKLKYGAPLTGSASGVKSISLKDAGEVLTQGIVTLAKNGLGVDPAALAFALPVGKLAKAARAARAAGRAGEAAALEARIGAKFSGQLPATTSSGMYSPFGQDSRERLRQESLSLFPRLTPGTGNVMNASIQEVAQYLRKMQIDDIGRGTKFIKRPK